MKMKCVATEQADAHLDAIDAAEAHQEEVERIAGELMALPDYDPWLPLNFAEAVAELPFNQVSPGVDALRDMYIGVTVTTTRFMDMMDAVYSYWRRQAEAEAERRIARATGEQA